jgi:prepilin-type N-terminal cleavage/methylation domain-containing protein
MKYRITLGQRAPYRGRLGFTMVELVLVFTIIGILAAMTIPKIARTIQATQVQRAAAMVSGDMEAAFTLAARQRKPMRIACNCGNASYTVADRADGTVRLSRRLVGDSDLGNFTLAFSATPIDVFPHGVATAPFTVTITSGASTRTISVSTAGHVRVGP